MDSVCLRTASMEWNVPGKYGPHGELFFNLMQKEPAMVPDRETFSPFINSDIRFPLFSRDDLKMCALLTWHINCGRRKRWRWISSPRFGRGMEIWLPKESIVGK